MPLCCEGERTDLLPVTTLLHLQRHGQASALPAAAAAPTQHPLLARPPSAGGAAAAASATAAGASGASGGRYEAIYRAALAQVCSVCVVCVSYAAADWCLPLLSGTSGACTGSAFWGPQMAEPSRALKGLPIPPTPPQPTPSNPALALLLCAGHGPGRGYHRAAGHGAGRNSV